ncbi:unnamed protein product [Camellia sinensis]
MSCTYSGEASEEFDRDDHHDGYEVATCRIYVRGEGKNHWREYDEAFFIYSCSFTFFPPLILFILFNWIIVYCMIPNVSSVAHSLGSSLDIVGRQVVFLIL